MRILLQNPTQPFNARIQKGENARMPELLFNQDAEQKTFQVSTIHRLPKFSHEDLESHRHISLFPFSFKLVQPCQSL
jgi:hypothetical protein